MPITIDFLANVRDFLRGTKDVDSALDDVADSLDDVARDGDQATEKLERSFKDLARSARDTRDDVDSIGVKGESGFRRLGDKGAEVSGELRQNLGETFATFRGDLEDLPQIAQDTLGGLAGSGALGGVAGLAATAAGAAGLGLLIGAFQAAGEEQERLKEAAQEWAKVYIEDGGKVLSAATVTAKGLDVLSESYDQVAKNAELWGVSEATALAAMSGSETAIGEVSRNIDGLRDSYEKLVDTESAFNMDQTINVDLLNAERAWKNAKGPLDELTGAMDLGARQADTYSYFLRDYAANLEGATVKVDEFGDSVYSLPDGTTIYVDAETGQATMNVDAIERKVYGLPAEEEIKIKAKDQATAEVDSIVRSLSNRTVFITTRTRPGGGEF